MLSHSEDDSIINLPSPPPEEKLEFEDNGETSKTQDLPPVLSPPEEYRDHSSPERSMTHHLGYPEEESLATAPTTTLLTHGM